MSVCKLETVNISAALSEIENYIFMNDGILDLSSEESIRNFEEEVTVEIARHSDLVNFTTFNLQDFIENSPQFKDGVETIFADFGIEVPAGLVGATSMSLLKTQVSSKFTSGDVEEMFHTLPMVKLEFDNYLTSKLTVATVLNSPKAKSFVTTDADVTNNLHDLKEELFQNIQEFLKSQGVIKRAYKLFDQHGAVRDYKHYTRIMTNLENYFFKENKFKLVQSYNKNKTVPNLEGEEAGNITEAMRQAYFDGVILNNFDTVVGATGMVDVNYNQFSNLWADASTIKYRKTFEGLKTTYFKDGSHESEGVSSGETKLLKLIVSSIPAYNKKGEKTGNLLETKDFYLFGAKIADYEMQHGLRLRKDSKSGFVFFNENPKKALKWYIDNTANPLKSKAAGMYDHFKYNTEFAISLDNFIKSRDYNIREKEKNSDESLLQVLSQVFNNSFGASYITYNTNGKYMLRSAYNQNFNFTRVQDTVFNKMYNNFQKNLYDVERDRKKILEIFDKLKGSSDVVTDAVKKLNTTDRVAISRFLLAKTGINISYLGVEDFLEDLSHDGNELNTKPMSYTGLINSMNSLIASLGADFSNVKKEIGTDRINKISKGDETTAEYIGQTIKNNAFKAIAAAYLANTTIKPLMTIQTLTGESIPTFKTANLTYKDTELLWDQYQKEVKGKNNTVYRSLLAETNENVALLGTHTKLELVNEAENKSAGKFNVGESFLGDFQFGFMQSLVKNNSFDVMIGNYSDKSTILTKTISALFKQAGSEVEVTKLPQNELLDLVRRQSENYYKDLLTKVLQDYSKLLKITVNTNTSQGILEGVAKVNAALGKVGEIESLSPLASKLGIDFTKELHYSNYNRKPAMNQLIVDNFRIFSTVDPNNSKSYPLFNEFVAAQENSFAAKYKHYNSDAKTVKLSKDFTEESWDDLLKKLGLTEKDKGLDLEKDGKLNPILKKWLWLQSLYRNEYLYMTGKGEYMHPAKGLAVRPADAELNMNAYMWESSERLKTMGKRNVMYTSTIEIPTRKTRFGVPEDVNVAVVNDATASLFNISGQLKNQDIHDGSSYINSLYSKMVDASFPGKGYKGTKKPFGTFLTDYGVVIKKDAEFELTNDRIRNSKYSSLKLADKQRQMLSVDVGNLDMDFDLTTADNYYYKNGKRFKINNVTIRNVEVLENGKKVKKNRAVLNVSEFKQGNWVTADRSEISDFTTLHDLWELFGGMYSSDENGKFNEGSNDLLFRVITSEDKKKKFPLKDKMIHIVSNASSIKAGGVNINSMSAWKNGDYLSFATFKNRFIGPQLDANHEANDSQIKEITQVISSLAQNPNTAEIAQEAYEDIANIIQESINPYLRYLDPNEDGGTPDLKELYKYISERFVKTINTTKGDNIAKVLVHSFKEDVNIPFSNQNFYVAFVRDIITKMNNEFITRYYSGIGTILAPSHGIIQLYQDSKGALNSQEDIIHKALNQAQLNDPNIAGTMTNDQIIADYIEKKYKPKQELWANIEIGDTVLLRPKRGMDLTVIETRNPQFYEMAKEATILQLNQKALKEEDLELAIEQKIKRYIGFATISDLGGNEETSLNDISESLKTIDVRALVNNGAYMDNLEKFNDFNNFIDSKLIGKGDFTSQLGYISKTLETPMDYYHFKRNSQKSVYKDYRVPRDLKPSSLKFELGNGEIRNQYDLDSVRLLFKLNEVENNGLTHEKDSDVELLQEFASYLNGREILNFYDLIKDKKFTATLRKYLGK